MYWILDILNVLDHVRSKGKWDLNANITIIIQILFSVTGIKLHS